MAEEETFGLDDELPEWAEQDQHGVPEDPADPDDGSNERLAADPDEEDPE